MMTMEALGLMDALNAFELAALVYDDGIAVDRVMTDFARELKAAGRRVGGIVQLPPGPETEPGQVDLLDVATGDVFPLKQRLGPGAQSCSLDSGRLADASSRIRTAIDAGVDLVFISKFSKQEIAGQGLRSEFGAAAAARVPLLTSIRRTAIDPWFDFTGGIGTLLAPETSILRDWWREIDGRRGPAGGITGQALSRFGRPAAHA